MDFDNDESEQARTIFCGNLSNKVTEELLYELFLQAGPLEKVTIPVDRDGRIAAYGFITFKHKCSVEYALRLFDGIHLYSCRLNLRARKQDNNCTPNSPQPKPEVLPFVSLPLPMVSMPHIQFNAINMPQIPLQQVPLPPLHNNQNRTPTGRNDQYRNESLQARGLSYSSKRDRDNMRPNDNHRHNNYKRHKR